MSIDDSFVTNSNGVRLVEFLTFELTLVCEGRADEVIRVTASVEETQGNGDGVLRIDREEPICAFHGVSTRSLSVIWEFRDVQVFGGQE